MIEYGVGLILSAGPALLGVLAELRARALRAYHADLLDDPLIPPRTRLERRHVRRACATCSLLGELVVTRYVPPPR